MTTRLSAVVSRHGYLTRRRWRSPCRPRVFLPGRDTFAKGQWALLYLLVILLVASAAGTGPAILAAVLAFFAWNFFFLPPYHTLAMHDPKDWLSLVAFLVVGLHRRPPGRTHARTRGARPRARAGDRGAQPAQRRRRLPDVDRAHGGDLPQRDRRRCSAPSSATSSCSTATTCARTGRRRAGARRRRRRRRARPPRPSRRATAPRRRPARRSGGGSAAERRRALRAGPQPFRRRPACSPCRPRANGAPYSAGDARLVTSLGNLVGAFLERERLQAAATRGRGRARGRPAQVEPAVVGVARAQDAARRAHRDGEQPARERRATGTSRACATSCAPSSATSRA